LTFKRCGCILLENPTRSERVIANPTASRKTKSNPAAADGPPGRGADVRARIIAGLARVRAVDIAEIEQEMQANGGDLQVESPQAEAIIGMLEVEFDRELPGPEDLRPEQFNSIANLTRLVERKLNQSGGQSQAGRRRQERRQSLQGRRRSARK
jgi:acyl carrier protein